jgi:hypothetical protein
MAWMGMLGLLGFLRKELKRLLVEGFLVSEALKWDLEVTYRRIRAGT